jgi:hypothetical protein
MALVDLWRNSRNQLEDKHVKQIIAFAGGGRLLDARSGPIEFREFLATIPSRFLLFYADQCLSDSFVDSGFALQDIVNEVGSRLGFNVTNGRYRGTSKHIGFDGLWCFPSGHAAVVEVKTTDAYRIDLDAVAGYRKGLIKDETINELQSSILIVVGRKDTGDLEAQIRGSRHAWDVRLISVDALLRLMLVKEEVDDPRIIQRIHDILIPREFTRLDQIVEIVFSATEDVKSEAVESESINDIEEEVSPKEPKFTPVSFHQACVDVIEKRLGLTLIKRTRTGYSTADNATALICAISKEHQKRESNWYWFAFHPHQQEFLETADNSFVAFGCGSADRTIMISASQFLPWLSQMNTTEREDRHYWHVHISRQNDDLLLHLKKGFERINLSPYLIDQSN